MEPTTTAHHRAEALGFVAAVQAIEGSVNTLRAERADGRLDSATYDRRLRRTRHEVTVGLKLAQVHALLAVAEEIGLLREQLLIGTRPAGVHL